MGKHSSVRRERETCSKSRGKCAFVFEGHGEQRGGLGTCPKGTASQGTRGRSDGPGHREGCSNFSRASRA